MEEGLEPAINPKVSKRVYSRKLDGEAEAFLVTTACSLAPEGYSDWTMQLLADRLVKCEIVDSISSECVRQTLKKNDLKPWLKTCWVIPPKENAGFVCAKEDILEVYQRSYKENEVLVCMDETSKPCVKESRIPLSAEPGKPRRFDYEYERNGVNKLFMLSALLIGWRHVKVTGRHTRIDGARRIVQRLEIQYTPKPGSRLDMAEIEIGVMSGQCLNRRMPDQETLRAEINAWQ